LLFLCTYHQGGKHYKGSHSTVADVQWLLHTKRDAQAICLPQSYLASTEIEPIKPASKASNGLFLEGAFLNIKRQ